MTVVVSNPAIGSSTTGSRRCPDRTGASCRGSTRWTCSRRSLAGAVALKRRAARHGLGVHRNDSGERDSKDADRRRIADHNDVAWSFAIVVDAKRGWR